MTLNLLPRYNGAAIQVMLDGAPALALMFLKVDGVEVTSLCYVGKRRRCPVVNRHLNEAEIDSIKPVSRNELASDIALTSEKKKAHRGVTVS